MYNIFGSGSTHAAHAQFMFQSAVDNNGKKIGLSRGATSRMASWFYSMSRMLRLRSTLEGTIAQKKFRNLTLNLKERLAVADILNPLFWKAVFTLLRAVFPALRCLRYCDMNTPAMDKIALLAHRTCVALEGLIEALNDRALFNSDACTSGLDDEQDELFELDDRFHDM